MSAKAIMVQGTMSGVGKSLLVAGLCRIFYQDGYAVAPFKSQNMSLNSAITHTGDEMGRAQVVQAEAAGVEPVAAMNPILLKPTTNIGSQVIVAGQVFADMTARDYFAFKSALKPRIKKAYDELAAEYDIIVIEGAGSPAEINLKQDDIVNMGIAMMASSPVLLVGDIDRGGVFAQLIGTMMLLDPNERTMVKATIVNKFRGDVSILEPGLDVLCEKCGVPVAGVVPYMQLDIDDEDSLSDRFCARTSGSMLDIAVICLPKISNFTDFIALSAIDGVSVRYVKGVTEFGDPDLVMLPGTKSTIADLRWLRECGLEAKIKQTVYRGTPVFGICGGYQMLGHEISDPYNAEGGGTIYGMGLLPCHTVFDPAKHQVRSHGAVECISGPLAALSGAPLEGYQIHLGQTVRTGGEPLVKLSSENGGTPKFGGCHKDGVYGCYLHGFFDRPECAQALVGALAKKKNINPEKFHAVDLRSYKEAQYNKLAQGLRTSLDMELIYDILDEGI